MSIEDYKLNTSEVLDERSKLLIYFRIPLLQIPAVKPAIVRSSGVSVPPLPSPRLSKEVME